MKLDLYLSSDYTGTPIPFDKFFKFSMDSIRFNTNEVGRVGRPGINPIGDNQVTERGARLEAYKIGEDDTDWIADRNSVLAGIINYIDEGNKILSIIDTDNLIRAKFIIKSISHDPVNPGNEYRIHNLSIDLAMQFPFWEGNVLNSSTNFYVTGETETKLNNSQIGFYPLIRFTPTASTIFDFSLLINDSIVFSWSGIGLTFGTYIEIDCKAGTCLIGVDKIDVKQFIVAGSIFPKFKTVTNDIKYISPNGSGNINIKYRDLYAF